LTLGLLVWSVAPAWGQVDDAPRLDAIWEAYQQFEYEAARELARVEAFTPANPNRQPHDVRPSLPHNRKPRRTD
jgi:cytochrome c556